MSLTSEVRGRSPRELALWYQLLQHQAGRGVVVGGPVQIESAILDEVTHRGKRDEFTRLCTEFGQEAKYHVQREPRLMEMDLPELARLYLRSHDSEMDLIHAEVVRRRKWSAFQQLVKAMT